MVRWMFNNWLVVQYLWGRKEARSSVKVTVKLGNTWMATIISSPS